jgi:uncharacterized membrane protein YfcA
MTEWLALLFAGLTAQQGLILLLASFCGSLLTAALGVGGGALLITVMAGIVPPLALIPLHGVVQMGSNASRAWLTRRYTQWPRVGWFLAGSVVAAALGGLLLNRIDEAWIPLMVGLFILWLSWGPMPALGLSTTRTGLFSGGLLTTGMTVLVGATGPLVSAWLGRAGMDKWQYTANFSSIMSLQHGLKLLVFTVAGFAFHQWLPMMAAMIVCGYIGTRVGLKLLGKIPETQFRYVFRWLLTLLAMRLVWQFFSAAH